MKSTQEKIEITEGSEQFPEVKGQWLKMAGDCSIESLPEFLKDLTESYQHDYGTICHAIAIAAIAAANAVNKSPTGGITGFQAGCVMWEFIRHWNKSDNKTGLSLVDYDNFLFPQYDSEFDKAIPSSVWQSIQKQAAIKLFEADHKWEEYLSNLEQYKVDMAAFTEKYPDYEDRKEHYDHLSMGTSADWDKEREKKESGFEFSPTKPFASVDPQGKVYKHWLSIVDGVVPFGYRAA